MHKLEYSNSGVSVEIQYNADRIMISDPDITAYMLALEELHTGGNLATFTVQHLANPATDWTYHFESKTGAEWSQTLRFTNPPMSSGSYDMVDLEKVIEKHQVVRRQTIALIKKYDIYKIEVVWD